MTRWSEASESWRVAFNSPLECGLRTAVVLASAYPQRLDLQRLVHYDYLLVHSGDVEGGPPSLHPATPHRSGELLVRRPLIELGITLMMSKSVIECEFSRSGIQYMAGEWSVAFLDALESNYVAHLRLRADWVIDRFSSQDEQQLNEYMRSNWSNWGAEFEYESLVRSHEE